MLYSPSDTSEPKVAIDIGAQWPLLEEMADQLSRQMAGLLMRGFRTWRVRRILQIGAIADSKNLWITAGLKLRCDDELVVPGDLKAVERRQDVGSLDAGSPDKHLRPNKVTIGQVDPILADLDHARIGANVYRELVPHLSRAIGDIGRERRENALVRLDQGDLEILFRIDTLKPIADDLAGSAM